jgi:double-stranded uracil-DNA glycosylase
MGETPWRPTSAQLQAARSGSVPDVLAEGLDVVFVGINPGLYSAAVRHHFARPGNRFWKALHRSGFTPREWSPFDDEGLVTMGIGITNLVDRPTATAAELTRVELRAGRATLASKMARTRPRTVAVLGVTAYRSSFGEPHAALGPQDGDIAGIPVWVLPNPSGLNAHHQIDDLVARFRTLRAAVGVR